MATTTTPPERPNKPQTTGRIAAIDWMRGFVMLLMTIDHASMSYNGGRVALDSFYPIDMSTHAGWVPGMDLPMLQFFTRWVTHLCAPTFLFLSGTSLALSLEKRRGERLSERDLDVHLFIRGGVVLACEGVLSLLASSVILQVLYAISLSLWLMIPLRRLDSRLLVALGLGWFAVGEWITTSLVPLGTLGSFPLRMLFAPGVSETSVVIYPVAGWLAMMMLGWGFGRWLLGLSGTPDLHARVAKRCALGGATGLAVFVAVRGLDAYGNMGLHRDGASLVQWLHVSKYPPALAYAALELGVMALCMAVAFAIEQHLEAPPSRWNPLRLFGQTALVYYMLHFIGLAGSALAITGGMGQRGLRETWIATFAAMLVLYPVCAAWRAYKSAHPRGWAQ